MGDASLNDSARPAGIGGRVVKSSEPETQPAVDGAAVERRRGADRPASVRRFGCGMNMLKGKLVVK